jgi:hypothetical protein
VKSLEHLGQNCLLKGLFKYVKRKSSCKVFGKNDSYFCCLSQGNSNMGASVTSSVFYTNMLINGYLWALFPISNFITQPSVIINRLRAKFKYSSPSHLILRLSQDQND